MTKSTTDNGWIRTSRYDLAFVFGGALFGALLPLLALPKPEVLLPIFIWAWLVFFEGAHFWATTSRSYLDAEFRRENPGALTFSLVFFLLPTAAWFVGRQTGSSMPKELYGLFIFLWSLYHVLRQHYGFFCIYQRKSGLPVHEEGSRLLYHRLFAATVICGASFLFLYRLPGQFGETARWVPASLEMPLRALAAAAVLGLLAATLIQGRAKVSGRARALFAIVVLFNLWVLVGVPAIGPLYPNPRNFPQTILLFIVLNSIFHNTQYHAIVWHYHRQAAPAWLAYALPALVFGGIFALFNFMGGQLPLLDGTVSSGTFSDLSFCFLNGVIGHHFYLDGKIWKLRRSPSLKARLSLEPAALAGT